jgi:hypothetical protein
MPHFEAEIGYFFPKLFLKCGLKKDWALELYFRFQMFGC